MKLKSMLASVALAGALASTSAIADDYVIDTKGAHAFIQFRIQHLGYSWLYGRFNTFDGEFSYDEKAPENASINVNIDTTSVDTNHAERDKHVKSADFFDVSKYPTASFKSSNYKPNGDGTGTLTGDFNFHGVTKSIDIAVSEVGAGPDPWGNERRGFEGTTKISLTEFGIKNVLGPKSEDVEITLSVEGIKK